jgi:hypothetical protein
VLPQPKPNQKPAPLHDPAAQAASFNNGMHPTANQRISYRKLAALGVVDAAGDAGVMRDGVKTRKCSNCPVRGNGLKEAPTEVLKRTFNS